MSLHELPRADLPSYYLFDDPHLANMHHDFPIFGVLVVMEMLQDQQPLFTRNRISCFCICLFSLWRFNYLIRANSRHRHDVNDSQRRWENGVSESDEHTN